jgi:dUTP pyrophosphatase
MIIHFKRFHPKAIIPTYAYTNDSGLDLSARLDHILVLAPHETALISTGIGYQLEAEDHDPPGLDFEGQVRPRSSLSSKGILGALGTIDAGYTGEIYVSLINTTDSSFWIKPDSRIAQLVICPIFHALRARIINTFLETDRGSRGFGSTGS